MDYFALFQADALRDEFEANKHVEDIETIDRMIADGEASYNKWRHPDPYIVPWAPGGSKFTRNPTPPSGNCYNLHVCLHIKKRTEIQSWLGLQKVFAEIASQISD